MSISRMIEIKNGSGKIVYFGTVLGLALEFNQLTNKPSDISIARDIDRANHLPYEGGLIKVNACYKR